jgi:hypothetical protein
MLTVSYLRVHYEVKNQLYAEMSVSHEYSILLRIIILNIKERKCQSIATIYIVATD